MSLDCEVGCRAWKAWLMAHSNSEAVSAM